MRLFIGEFVLLGLVAGLVGCLFGFGVQFVLAGLLGSLVGFPLPAPGGCRRCTGWRYRCVASPRFRLAAVDPAGAGAHLRAASGSGTAWRPAKGWRGRPAHWCWPDCWSPSRGLACAWRLGGRLCAGLCGVCPLRGWRSGCSGGAGGGRQRLALWYCGAAAAAGGEPRAGAGPCDGADGAAPG